jgi:hypothetical protein
MMNTTVSIPTRLTPFNGEGTPRGRKRLSGVEAGFGGSQFAWGLPTRRLAGSPTTSWR